jgi:hypothetical protein
MFFMTMVAAVVDVKQDMDQLRRVLMVLVV